MLECGTTKAEDTLKQYGQLKEDGGRNTNPKASKLFILLGAVAVLFFVLWIIFLGLYLSSKDIPKTDNDLLSKRISDLTTENAMLQDRVTILSDTNESQSKQITMLNANVIALNHTVIKLTELTNAKAAVMLSPNDTNLILWIVSGTSLALNVGGGIFGYYLWQQVNSLQTQLATMTQRYYHFRSYFDNSYLWTVEDYMLYYIYDNVWWHVLYDSTIEWNFTTLAKNLTGQMRTVTLIMTEQDYLIAGVLLEPWRSDGLYVRDSKAFTMSVNRVCELLMPTYNPIKYNYAARLNNSMLAFGENEILINPNKTGSAIANVTFEYPYWYLSDPKTFYANQPNFNIKWFKVLQWNRQPRSPQDLSRPFRSGPLHFPT